MHYAFRIAYCAFKQCSKVFPILLKIMLRWAPLCPNFAVKISIFYAQLVYLCACIIQLGQSVGINKLTLLLKHESYEE